MKEYKTRAEIVEEFFELGDRKDAKDNIWETLYRIAVNEAHILHEKLHLVEDSLEEVKKSMDIPEGTAILQIPNRPIDSQGTLIPAPGKGKRIVILSHQHYCILDAEQ